MNDLNFWGKVQSGYYVARFVTFDYEDYEKELLDELDNTPLIKADYDLGFAKIKEAINDLKRQHLQEYRNEESRLVSEFFEDCEKEFGFSNFPNRVKDFIHSKAYEDGHAYGFSEIANKYGELVEFANICKESFNK